MGEKQMFEVFLNVEICIVFIVYRKSWKWKHFYASNWRHWQSPHV